MLIGDWDLPMLQLTYSFTEPHAAGPELLEGFIELEKNIGKNLLNTFRELF